MKRIHFNTLIALACVAALAAGSAMAQQQQQQPRQRQQSQQRQQQQPQQQKGQQRQIATLSGRVQDVRSVNLDGEGQPHVLAKIQLSNGKTAIVDLGTREDVRDLRPRRGQNLSVMGRAGRINGRPIIVADRARDESRPDAVITIFRVIPLDLTAGQGRQQQQGMQQQQRRGTSPQQFRERADTYRQLANQARQQGDDQRARRYQQQAQRFAAMANRGGQQQQAQSQQRQQQRQQQARQGQSFDNSRTGQQQRRPSQAPANPVRFVVGRITDTRDIQIQGISDSHKLVKLQTDQGRTVIVDLGRNKDLQDVKLTPGERVSALGVLGRINGKPVLFASHVADMVAINRQSGQQGSPGDQAQTAGARQDAEQQQQQRRQQQERQQQQQ